MRGRQPAPRLHEGAHDLERRPRRPVPPLAERLPLHVFHRHEDVAFPNVPTSKTVITFGCDSFAITCASRSGRASPSGSPAVDPRTRAEQLHGDAAIELRIEREVHDPHPARAEAPDDRVSPQRRAIRELHPGIVAHRVIVLDRARVSRRGCGRPRLVLPLPRFDDRATVSRRSGESRSGSTREVPRQESREASRFHEEKLREREPRSRADHERAVGTTFIMRTWCSITFAQKITLANAIVITRSAYVPPAATNTSKATALCSVSSTACQRHSAAIVGSAPSSRRGLVRIISPMSAVKCSSAHVAASCAIVAASSASRARAGACVTRFSIARAG